MKVYIYKIFNLVNKLYLDDYYFDLIEAVNELIYLDKRLGKGLHEIHKIQYTTVLILEDE